MLPDLVLAFCQVNLFCQTEMALTIFKNRTWEANCILLMSASSVDKKDTCFFIIGLQYRHVPAAWPTFGVLYSSAL